MSDPKGGVAGVKHRTPRRGQESAILGGGTEQKGRQFDSSIGQTPFTFTLGAGQVIAGFDRGASGMKVGGQRRVIVPPDLGYGSVGSQGGGIPPNATLVFDIELLEVQG